MSGEVTDSAIMTCLRWMLACALTTALGAVEVTESAKGIAIRNGKSVLTEAAHSKIYWRYAGEKEWRESERIDWGKVEVKRASLPGGAVQFSGSLRNTGSKPVELARFHYLDGPIASGYGFLELQGVGNLRLVRAGESIPPQRKAHEDLWMSMKVYWPQLPEPVHDAANWSLSRDTGAFLPAWNEPGWFAGFTGPGTAFGEVGFRTESPGRFFVGVLLDNVVLGPGETRTLESFRLGFGDWQAQVREWAVACAREAPARTPKPPLRGYCSWYQKGPEITPGDLLRAAKEFASWPVPPGGRTVQLDDGWQTRPAEWTPNAKFASVWPELPQRIADTGAIPGLWIAPTTVHHTHPIVKEHPEWLQRLPDGKFAIHFANWGGDTYIFEDDRPDVREFMAASITEARREGWRYLKIDFTYPVSTARVAYDRKKTSFETQRDFYRLMRQTAGEELLLNACVGEPARYALGQVDIARLGGDTGSDWPTVQSNLRRTLSFAATNGVWWQGDPDVYYMRREKTRLTPEENYVLTGTLGLIGGVFLTSDWPSQWTPEAAESVRKFWTGRVPVEEKMLLTADGAIRAYLVAYKDGGHAVGIYNWSDQPATTRVTREELGLGPGEPLGFPNQPAHSLRIVSLSK
jgi:hypothetical protein